MQCVALLNSIWKQVLPIDLDKVVKLLTFLRGNPILKPSRLSFRKPFYFMAIFAFDTANNFTLQRTRRNFAETEKLIHKRGKERT